MRATLAGAYCAGPAREAAALTGAVRERIARATAQGGHMNHARAFALVSGVIVAAGGAALATTPPSLAGRSSGSYVIGGTTSSQSLQIEVEAQHGRRLRVSLFAMNQPEYQGHGRLAHDDATVRMALHATGHRHLTIAA